MDLIGQLASNGVMGLLLAIALYAVYLLYKEIRQKTKDYNDLQEKRLVDATQYRDVYTKMSQDNREILDKILIMVTVWDSKLKTERQT